MKKILYLIPLFIFLFIISPNKTFATTYTDILYLENNPLSDEQREEYLNIVFSSEEFKTKLQDYPYYFIGCNTSGTYFIPNGRYKEYIFIIFYSNIPTFTLELSYNNPKVPRNLIVSSYDTFLAYNISTSDYNYSISSLESIRFITTSIQYNDGNDNVFNRFALWTNNILASNIEYSFGNSYDLYDSNMNFIRTIAADENIFPKYEEPKEVFTIESISNADSSLYNLSVELLGDLPEEFTFLYSICQLFLGIIIILIVLSPAIILLRLFR